MTPGPHRGANAADTEQRGRCLRSNRPFHASEPESNLEFVIGLFLVILQVGSCNSEQPNEYALSHVTVINPKSRREKISRGELAGPKIVACGPIIDGPNSWSNPEFTISVKNAEEARTAVDSLKREGSDCIKVYDGLSRDSYYAIIDQGKKLNLLVVGHLPSAISVRKRPRYRNRSDVRRL
jgi:hypothetical protein